VTRQQVQAAVLNWVQHEAGFAQLVTVNRGGFPVGRSIGAPVNDDWSVDLVQRGVHRRLQQLRRDPHVEVTWVGTPAPGSRNEYPAVFDYGWLVPRVVFLQATAEIMPTDWTVARYGEQIAVLQRRGVGTKAPLRSPEHAADDLVGVRLHPVRVRAEGFGEGAENVTWNVEENP